MYLSTDKHEREIDIIFSGLFFERIHIPDFVHGTPENAQASLLAEISVAEENLMNVKDKIRISIDENIDKLSKVKSKLIFLNKINKAREYVVIRGDNWNITGFVKNRDISNFKKHFNDIEGVEVLLLPSDSDKRLKKPVKMK